jgi:hypothetical protein
VIEFGGMRRALWLFIITIVGLCVHAGAQPQLSVDVGWESRYRSGRWTPIYITLSDSAPREVMLEVQAPYDRRYQIFIRQGLTISPTPITVPIYIPLNQSLQETQITLRSASGRRLASMPLEEDPMASAINRTTGILPVDPAGLFIGVSGAMATEKMLATQLSSDRVTVAYLPPQRLPAVPVGYEGIDVLMLNAPDVNRIAIDQQEAIMQWVRAGGNLVMWPGPEPVPVTSPIVDALPVRIGENQNYEFDVKALRSAGLPDRFAKLKGRALTTMPSSVKVNLLSQPEAAGIGRGWDTGRSWFCQSMRRCCDLIPTRRRKRSG